jgi:hypothetical protein
MARSRQSASGRTCGFSEKENSMNHASFRNLILVAFLCFACGLAACGSKMEGTYADPSGAFVLVLKSGGNATFSFAGDTASCTYGVNGDKLSLDCKGDAGKMVFTIQSDGALAPPQGFIQPLHKTK